MKLKPHPRYGVYRAWFDGNRAKTISVAEVYYRVAGPSHTTAAEIVQGVGAFLGGGRWNPPGVMNAVYLSRMPETAMFEANEHRRYYKLPLWEVMPKVTVAVRVEVDSILDLADAAISASLPEPPAVLLAEDWRAVMERGDEPTTQTMGRAAFDSGLKGLLVPSKPHPAGVNLLIFPQRLTPGCVLRVVNPLELENLGKPA